MGTYDRQKALATRLIKKKGQLVVWQRQGLVQNSTTPWKHDTSTPPAPIPVFIVFLSPKTTGLNELFHLMQGTSVPDGAPRGLMASVSFIPAIDDTVIRGTDTLRIKSMDIVAPDGDPILYKLEFA